MSGICPNEACTAECSNMQLKKTNAYIIMSIHDNKEVCIDEAGAALPKNCPQAENEKIYNEHVFDKLIADEKKEPKYVMFDVRRQTKDGDRDDIVIISWCPNECPVKKRMTHASTFEDLKKRVSGWKKAIQANDADELSYKTILEELQKK